MLDQIPRSAVITHSIKHHINAFSTGQFGRWDKVRVRCDNNNLVDLPFESERGDIQAKPHIDTFLLCVDFEVSICRDEVGWAFDEPGRCRFGQPPARGFVEAPQSKGNFPKLLHLSMKFTAKDGFRRFSEIYRTPL